MGRSLFRNPAIGTEHKRSIDKKKKKKFWKIVGIDSINSRLGISMRLYQKSSDTPQASCTSDTRLKKKMGIKNVATLSMTQFLKFFIRQILYRRKTRAAGSRVSYTDETKDRAARTFGFVPLDLREGKTVQLLVR